MPAPVASIRPTFVSLRVPLSSVPPFVDTKALHASGAVASASVPPFQESAEGSIGQTQGATVPVAIPAASTMVVKQSEPVRLYTGANSYKACMEYFERICVCDDWKSPRSAPVTFWLLWMVPPPKLYVGLRPRRTPTLHTFGKPWPPLWVC